MTERRTRAQWFYEAKWGVFMHFLAAPASSSGGAETDADAWNRRVDAFDVAGAARQLQEVGARYFVITLGQNSGHYCTPNATYDELVGIRPSKCSRRDLVAELYEELAPRGIRLLTYLPTGAPEFEPQAVARLEWAKGGRLASFQRKWEAIIREWALRWGPKVSGWWLDGGYFADDMYRHAEEPNFRSFAAALRAGNPDCLVAWNPGVKYPPYTVDVEEDYTAGEINEPQEVDSPGRWDQQAQFHILTFLGKYWGQGPIRFSPAQAAAHTRAITDYGGVVTWDVPLTERGLIVPEALPALREVGQAVDRTRGQDFPPPPAVVRPGVVFTEVPTVDAAGAGAGRLKLTLRNCQEAPLRGQVELISEPVGALTFSVGPKVPYDLPARGETASEIDFRLTGAARPEAIKVAVVRDGDGRRWEYPLPRREICCLPVLPQAPALEDLAAALAGVEAKRFISSDGRHLGEVRLAWAGGNLALALVVGDQILRQTPAIWDGSCVEVFGVAEPGGPIHQLFLQPAAANGPDRGWRFRGGSLPAPEIKYRTWPQPGGYRGAALIPLAWWLGQDAPPQKFYLELGLTTGGDESHFVRAALFGSRSASGNSDSYARIESAK